MVFGWIRKLKSGRHNIQAIGQEIKKPDKTPEQIQKEMSEEIKSLEKKDSSV